MITTAQCQSGRKLLRWNMTQLATAAELGMQSVVSFETGASQLRLTAEKLRNAFEAAGVEFFTEADGRPGVRLRKDGVS